MLGRPIVGVSGVLCWVDPIVGVSGVLCWVDPSLG